MTEPRGECCPDAVLRLAQAGRGQAPFLGAHHLDAARRLARLFDRARMLPRVTLSYDPARIGGHRGRPVQAELADSAAAARQRLAGLARQMPADCWNLLTDICGFDKGLQQVEAERNWPRRGAKLVLRIGLDQLAAIFGLSEAAEGQAGAQTRAWLPERAPMFLD
ncbi:MAG: hypothetical protein ABS75_26175 [Pelagibacterium sp. SCN 63-23]|nr:MAG: hypothetical protein ABS75_26175 [Pelagibacterium sp. SCN 63-23]